MAARGYEFYLRLLKVSLMSERSERVRDTFSTKLLHKTQLFKFIFETANQTSANLPKCSSISEKVSM